MLSNKYFTSAIEMPRTISAMATAVRLVQYPDGRQVLQGAYLWNQGFATGFEWKDLPVVHVGENGQGLIDD